MRVLIMDDNRNFGRFLYSSLATRGYESRAVSTVGEGLAAVGEDRFDLYLIDIMMPDGDGREFAKSLIETCGVPPDRIVLMTALERSRVEPGGLTTHPVLYKPFRLNGLLELLRELTVPG